MDSSSAPQQHDTAGGSQLDLAFLFDTTGSMGSYIASATANIETICDAIVSSNKLPSADALRLAVIAYRDHPPQDVSYVTKTLPFTSDVPKMKEFLKNLYASGGGDGPEASSRSMMESLELEWRANASRMIILITDAPPHGIGEYGDGFPNGYPGDADPLQLAREMGQRGIAFFVVACEPALSQYTYATDFFTALAQIPGGAMFPLTSAESLARVIIGSALEHVELDRLIQEVGMEVATRILRDNQSVDDVAKALHEALLLRNETTKTVKIKNIYRDCPEAAHNVEVWKSANTIAEARPHLKKVVGSRFTDAYLEERYGARSIYRSSAAPPVPPRSTTPPRSSTGATGSTTAGSPGSPSRSVVSSFASFSAPGKMSMESTPITQQAATVKHSMFGTIPAPTSPDTGAGASSSFSGVRSRTISMDDDDDDEGDEGGVQLRQGQISLDQAKRITMQSAWRGLRA